jgi:O6-methylguanine-DNA--protein-cysteine methyltransferase
MHARKVSGRSRGGAQSTGVSRPVYDVPSQKKRLALSRPHGDWFSGRSAPGSPFQSAVWDALLTISPGETWSYAQLARAVGARAKA